MRTNVTQFLTIPSCSSGPASRTSLTSTLTLIRIPNYITLKSQSNEFEDSLKQNTRFLNNVSVSIVYLFQNYSKLTLKNK